MFLAFRDTQVDSPVYNVPPGSSDPSATPEAISVDNPVYSG